jgi:hypothetical protein
MHFIDVRSTWKAAVMTFPVTIDQEERARHRAAMEEMVRQAIANQEVRDPTLEQAGLEALAERPS